MAAQIRSILASVTGVETRMWNAETRLNRVDDIPTRVTGVETRMQNAETRLNRLDDIPTRVTGVETRVKKAEEGLNKLDGLPSRVAALDQHLMILGTQKVALADYNTKMQAVDSLMDSLTASSSNSSNRLDTAEKSITDLTKALSQEKSAREALGATVSALDSVPGTVKVHQQAIVGMSAQIEERKAAIEDLQKQMANKTSALTAAVQTAEAFSRSKVSTLEEASRLQVTKNETFTTHISSVQQRIAEYEAQLDREKAKTVSLASQVGALKDQKVDQGAFDEKVMKLESAMSSQETLLIRTEERLAEQLMTALAREASEKAALKDQVNALTEENEDLKAKLNQTMLKVAEFEDRFASLFALMNRSKEAQEKLDADVKVISGSVSDLQKGAGVIEDKFEEVGRQFDTRLGQREADITGLQESVKTLSALTTARHDRTPSPGARQRVTFLRSTSQKMLVEK